LFPESLILTMGCVLFEVRSMSGAASIHCIRFPTLHRRPLATQRGWFNNPNSSSPASPQCLRITPRAFPAAEDTPSPLGKGGVRPWEPVSTHSAGPKVPAHQPSFDEGIVPAVGGGVAQKGPGPVSRPSAGSPYRPVPLPLATSPGHFRGNIFLCPEVGVVASK